MGGVTFYGHPVYIYIYEVEARQSTFVRGLAIQLSDKRIPSLLLNLDLIDEFWQCFHTGTVLLFSLLTTVDVPPIKLVSEGCSILVILH